MDELSIAISNEKEIIKRQKKYLQDKLLQLKIVSNPEEVVLKLSKYLNQNVVVLVSPKKNKKYRVFDEINRKFIDFGDINHEDFTKHKDEKRRKSYLNRATNIKGKWKENPYSPNNLSINGLW